MLVGKHAYYMLYALLFENAEKCHLLIFGEKSTNVSVQIGATSITESNEEKLSGVTHDKNLVFKNHIDILCAKLRESCMLLRISQTMWILRS